MEAVIFVGIQASGKTSFYRRHFADSHVHISLDAQRTRQREEHQLATCLKEGKSFVIDNTNPLPADRARYVSRSREAGFHVVAYFFSTTLKDALRRNNLRSGKQRIPVPAIAATHRKRDLVAPKPRAGAEDLVVGSWDGAVAIRRAHIHPGVRIGRVGDEAALQAEVVLPSSCGLLVCGRLDKLGPSWPGGGFRAGSGFDLHCPEESA